MSAKGIGFYQNLRHPLKTRTSAKKKYFTTNFTHLTHKACQILSTFTNHGHCPHLPHTHSYSHLLHCHSTTHYNGQHQYPPVKKMGNLYRFDVAEPKYGNQIAPSPTIFEREPSKSKTTFVVKYISASATATRKVYFGLRTRTGRGFTRSWDK